MSKLIVSILSLLIMFAYIPIIHTTLAGQQLSFAEVNNDSECMQSFHDFAYLGFPSWADRKIATYSNWHIESSVPSGPDNVPVGYPMFTLETSRMIDEQQEIWMGGVGDEGLIWLVYRPASDEWESIARAIDNTNLISNHLFVGEDGTLYSSLRWNAQVEFPDLETIPILAKFDENTRNFVIEEDMAELPFSATEMFYYGNYVTPWPLVIKDEQDIFWAFMNFDGLYSYNPTTNALIKHADITEYPINHATFAPDGSLFFSKQAKGIGSKKETYRIEQDMIFKFDPKLNLLHTLKSPNGDWPLFYGMLVDSNGVLRLGVSSYRTVDGNWYLMHPDPKFFFNHAGDHTFATPTLITESSDGRLWYLRHFDGSGSGTAWYDPESQSGCLISGLASNIIEDGNRKIWMIVNDNLYSQQLEQE